MYTNPSTLHSFDGALDTQTLKARAYWTRIRAGMAVAIALHVLFGIAALAMHVLQLAALQIVSIVVYSAALLLSRRHNRRGLITALAWLDLLGHSTIACWILGLESGFQFYSWLLLPLVFTNINRRVREKIAVALGLSIAYILIDIWLHNTPPLAHVHPYALLAMRYFNLFCFLLAVTMTALSHLTLVAAAEARLRSAAHTDTLTGLMNRRRMSDRMESEVVKARQGEKALAVLLLDIDHFKTINDRHGHGRGDEVLASIGRTLVVSVRQQDLVSRWGGEEFLVLLPGASPAVALDTAERIRREIGAMQFPDTMLLAPVTTTIGVATWQPGESLEATLHRADSALYAGKRAGRNRVVTESFDEHSFGQPDPMAKAG